MGQAQSAMAVENQSSPTTSTSNSTENSAQPSLDSLIAEAAAYGDEDDNGSLEAKAQKALECPCIAHLRSGPCGFQFSDAFVCFLKSTAEEKDDDVKKEEKPSTQYTIRPPLWSEESKASKR
ncbi:UNVERIFIED_CONTAM: Mitochondrial intermembrane space import and assembly protein 40 [Sesamum radiatum]|uniref:Mitochondrial intermembrane space import and assembly protein 40 n=1 Tax=Sesamum radiatum TaxID=300843 RepID=A0AAW2V9Q2_SESRA